MNRRIVVLLRNLAKRSKLIDDSLAYDRILIEDPMCVRSWGHVARAFALRFDWKNCRVAVRKAMARRLTAGRAATEAALSSLNLMAEQSQLGDVEWKGWFEALPPQAQATPDGVGLLVQTDDPRAPEFVSRMLAQGVAERDPNASLTASMGLAKQGDLQQAYVYLKRAFELDLPRTLRDIVMRCSAQAARIMAGSGNIDDLADWLTEHSNGCGSITVMPPNLAEQSIRSSLRRREKALERGLPSPILIAQGKSASVSVASIFTGGFDLPTVLYALINQRVIGPWLEDYQRGGGCYTTHLYPHPENIERLHEGGAKPIIVHIRDPRQQLVSLMEHYRRYTNQRDFTLQEAPADDDEAFDQIINQRLAGQIRWIEGWVDAEEKLGIKFTTFEEFVSDRPRFLERMLSYYGGDTRYFNKAAAAIESPSVDYHRRKGEIDEWRRRLSPKQADTINAAIPAAWWEKFGWRP